MNSNKKKMSENQICWCVLGLIVLTSAIIRYSLIDVPFERDEGEYAYAGQLILKGIPPYQEVYNMKLPGIYYLYALILQIFGQTHQSVHTALIFVNAISILFTFLLSKNSMTGLSSVFSAGCFAFLSLLGSVEGIFANAEHFVLLFALPGLCVLLRAIKDNSPIGFVLSGLLLGICFSIKQHGFAFCVFGGVYIVYIYSMRKPFNINKLFRSLCMFSVGVISVYAFMCSAMFMLGVFDKFWFWTVGYARNYILQFSMRDAFLLFYINTMDIILSAPILWAVIISGFIVLVNRIVSANSNVFMWLFFFFSFLSICPGFYFRPHYYILLLPSVSLIGGLAVDSVLAQLGTNLKTEGQKYLIVVTLAIFFLISFYIQRDYLFFMNPMQISRSIYGLNPFLESIPIAQFIESITKEDDRIAVLGSEPQIFFYSKRQSASGHIYMYPLMGNNEAALKMQKSFIKDMEINDPKYYIFFANPLSWLGSDESYKDVFKWFDELRKNGMNLVGVIEIFNNKTNYYWGNEVYWPPISSNYIAIFEKS